MDTPRRWFLFWLWAVSSFCVLGALVGCGEKPVASTLIQAQPVEQPRVLQGLQKQVRERDHQIAVLRAQLEALKAIDQDHADQQRQIKPPASLRLAEP
jgi:septal ring factor EnvC (AmiA/AmiB activator)